MAAGPGISCCRRGVNSKEVGMTWEIPSAAYAAIRIPYLLGSTART
jgi:hypothetical protein